MHIGPNTDRKLLQALEESEAIYWSKYYKIDSPLHSSATLINGAFAGAVPEVDILAMNRVIGLGMLRPASPEDLQRIIEFYRAAGAPRFMIQLSPYTLNTDMPAMLIGAGFRLHNNWVKLIRKTGADMPAVNCRFQVEEVTSQNAKQYGNILFRCFNWKEPKLADWLSITVGQPGYRHFIAYDNDEPAAAAAFHYTGPYASMAFAGTLPQYTGMGAQSLLLKTRINLANSLGVEYIFSETAEPQPGKDVASYRNMKRFGFETAYLRQNWVYSLED